MTTHPISSRYPGPAADLVRRRLLDGRLAGRTTPPRTWPKRSTSCPTSACSTSPAAAATRALAAARRTWGNVVGSDFVPALLERGRERAAAERLDIEFVEADAQELPFEDGELRRRDVDLRRDVRSRPAADRRRASARGQAGRPDRDGQLVPRRLGGDFFDDLQARAAASRRPLAAAWGTEEHVRELFGDGITDLRAERRVSRQPFRSPDHYLEFFRTYFGPTKTAFEQVGPEGEQALTADLRDLPRRSEHGRRAGDGARGRVPRGDRRPGVGAARRASARGCGSRRRSAGPRRRPGRRPDRPARQA